MKNLLIILFAVLLFLSCKKKETSEETPVTPTPANGNLEITVKSYDSLGYPEVGTINTSVFLSGTSFSSPTDANGKVAFNVPPSNYFPSIIRSQYEGIPFSANVTSNNTTTFTTNIYKNSKHGLQFTGGNAATTGSVGISFNLTKPVPSGKTVRVAVLFGTNSSLSVNSYSVVEHFDVAQQANTINVYQGALQTAIGALSPNTPFRLLAVPCSYGDYYSTILNKNILVGDYLPPVGAQSATIALTKTW